MMEKKQNKNKNIDMDVHKNFRKEFMKSLIFKQYTVEPRFYDRRFNDIPDLTINLLCPGKSYSKLYGAESRFNDIPGITMEI